MTPWQQRAGWLCGLLLCVACATPRAVDPRLVVEVLRDPAERTSQRVYELLHDAFVAGAPMPAGERARFAYHAARLGHRDEARRALEVERRLHPEAAAFVAVLARHLELGP